MLTLTQLEDYIRNGKVTESGLKKAGKSTLFKYCDVYGVLPHSGKRTVNVLIAAILKSIKSDANKAGRSAATMIADANTAAPLEAGNGNAEATTTTIVDTAAALLEAGSGNSEVGHLKLLILSRKAVYSA